jgi:hypothetical protein
MCRGKVASVDPWESMHKALRERDETRAMAEQVAADRDNWKSQAETYRAMYEEEHHGARRAKSKRSLSWSARRSSVPEPYSSWSICSVERIGSSQSDRRYSYACSHRQRHDQ